MAAAGADANGAEAEQAGQEQVPGPELEAAVLKDAVRTLLAAEASPRSHCNFLCKGSALWSDRGSPIVASGADVEISLRCRGTFVGRPFGVYLNHVFGSDVGRPGAAWGPHAPRTQSAHCVWEKHSGKIVAK